METCNDFTRSLYGFDFRGYNTLTQLHQEEDGQFGRCNELKCTLWSAFAQQFSDFLSTFSDHAKIIMARCVVNGYHGTILLLFYDTIPIVNDEFSDVKEYSKRLFAKQDIEISENTTTQLLDVAHGVNSIIVGTIIAIREEEGWWYIGCKGCKKKVIRSSDMVDLEADVPKKTNPGKNDWWRTKCKHQNVFRLQIRIQDESGTMSLTLWNDEVVDRSAYQLCDKYENVRIYLSIFIYI
ncbi:replication protein A 70 kDa DNA-binding subunit B [Tanacetum coccineum]